MNKYLLIVVSTLVFAGCGSSKRSPMDFSNYEHQTLDSTKIAASIQPIDYKWNTEGHLTDVLAKYDINRPFLNPFAVLLSFEDIKADTFIVYFCLKNSDKCVKIAEKYFDGGLYSLGFQKLEVESGLYDIKIVGSDIEYSNTYFISP